MQDNMFYGAGHLIFQRAEELRKTMTSAENIIWKHVHINEWKLKFRRQHPIRFYVVDFYCHKLKLVIEIDGSIHDDEKVKKKDAEREAILKNLGLNVIRFKNEEVYNNPNSVLAEIDKTIKLLQSTPLGNGGRMLIYNVTIKADNSIADVWLQWLLNEHIPEVMNTNCFSSYKVVRLLEIDDNEGPTYAIQYTAESKADYNRYIELHAPLLRQKSIDKWGNAFIAFRSLMEVVEEQGNK
jgi:very-short-patch-repair endonuclease